MKIDVVVGDWLRTLAVLSGRACAAMHWICGLDLPSEEREEKK